MYGHQTAHRSSLVFEPLSNGDLDTTDKVTWPDGAERLQSERLQPENASLALHSNLPMAAPCSASTSRTDPSLDKLSSEAQTEALLSTGRSELGNGTRSDEEFGKKQIDVDPPPLKPDPERCRAYLRYLVDSQENVARLRLQVQERRAALRNKRLDVSDCDRLFMDELYRWWSKNNGRVEGFGRLQDLYNQCQKVRMEVGPVDDDYEELELQLGEVEHANAKQTRRLISSLQNDASKIALVGLEHSPLVALDNLEHSTVDSHISFETSTSSEDHNHEKIEKNDEFKNVGDGITTHDSFSLGSGRNRETSTAPIPLAQQMRDQASAISLTDRRTGEEPRLFSETRLSTENGLLQNWNPVAAERDVAQIFERDLLDVPDDTSEVSRPYDEEFVLCNFDPKLNQSLSDLLFFREEQEMHSRSTLRDYLLEFGNAHSRVNRWLLHCVRTSYTEAMSLQQTISETGSMNSQWAEQALDLWEADEAAFSHHDSAPTDPATVSDSHKQLSTSKRAALEMQPDRLVSQLSSRSTDYPIFRWLFQGSELL